MSQPLPGRYWVIAAVLLLFLLQCNTLERYLAAPPPAPTDVPVENNVSELFISRATLPAGETTEIQVGVVKVVGVEVPLSYQWETSEGEITQGQGSCCITYQAPDAPGSYEVKLTVTYDQQTIQRAAIVQVTGQAPATDETPTEPTPTPTLVAGPTATPEPTDEPLDTAEAYFKRAQERYIQRDIEGTLADYTKAIELNYEPIYDPTYNRGYIYYAEQEYDQAIADFTKAIELNYEPLSLPFYNRGNAHYYIGKTKEAIEDYTKAIELKHEPLAWLYNSRGLAHRKLGEYDQAIEDYTMAIELEHDPLSWPLYNRANAFVDKGVYDQAIIDFTESLDLDPTNGNAYLGRALAYQALGDTERMIIDLNEAISFGDEYVKKEAESQLEALETAP